MNQGTILFAHGARDPRWAEPFHRLRDLVAARAASGPVELACLELMEPDLDRAVDRLVVAGCTGVSIVPVFFGQGAHLRRDLPAIVDGLRARLPGLDIRVTDAVGEDAAVLDAIADFCLRAAASA
jgi:sirohydrochlorin cobaltochelatase